MRRLKKNYYLAIFWGIVGILGMVRWIFDIETPQVDNDSVAGKVSTEQTLSVTTTSESNTNSHIAQEEKKEAPAKSKRKVLKSCDFRTFMVAETGLEPATSGL